MRIHNGYPMRERPVPNLSEPSRPEMVRCQVCGNITAKKRAETKPYCADHIDKMPYAASLMAEFDAMDTFDRPGKPLSSLPTYEGWVEEGRPVDAEWASECGADAVDFDAPYRRAHKPRARARRSA